MSTNTTCPEQLSPRTLAIMQPYFFPYIGYFQLMGCVSQFVVYDNIKFTKKGWIHRNRLLVNSADEYFTLPLKNASDSLMICERFLSDTFDSDKDKLLRRIEAAYKKAENFNNVFPMVERILNFKARNLFEYIYYSLVTLRDYLGIKTPLIVSSTIDMNHTLKGQDRVIETCKTMGAGTYINPIGGVTLYDKSVFKANNIELQFLEAEKYPYNQFTDNFVPYLSILDVLMFNDANSVQVHLTKYTLK